MTSGKSGALSPEEARHVYNRIGRAQDWQRFYEGAAVRDLISNAEFESAEHVFEFGCGTGALARDLLGGHLDSAATYRAVDISDTMVAVATERLARWADRCEILHVDGALPLPGDDGSADRFVSAYVFDLLDPEYTAAALAEAERLVAPGGRLCAVGLADGSTATSRMVSRSWHWLWTRAPEVVGGCRPVSVAAQLSDSWQMVHHRTVIAWGVPSEVLVATRRTRAGG